VTAYGRVIDALQAHGSRRSGTTGWQCPAHDDQIASLSVTNKGGNPLVNCQAGCDSGDVLAAVGLTWREVLADTQEQHRTSWIASYEYTDERGAVLFVKERGEPKTFRIYKPLTGGRREYKQVFGGSHPPRRVLYRLPAVMGAIRDGRAIYVVEGEKDVHAAEKAGAVATCNYEGAAKSDQRTKWRPEYGDTLKDAHVVIVADNDDAGYAHAAAVRADLNGKAASVRVVRGLVDSNHADLSDHLRAGHSLDDLAPLGDEPVASSTAGVGEEEEENEGEVPERRLILRPASGIRTRVVRWLWDTTPEGAPPTSHGRIPLYSLAIAAGAPGLGKSQYAVWMTARITTGTLPGELWGKPRAVIYAAAEDSWSYTIAPRLIAAGADMDLVLHVDVKDDGQAHARLTLPLDTSLLGKEAERHSVALLVMDPLLSYIDKGINDYRAAEVRQALEPLVNAADRHRFTILGLAHFTKFGAADPLARVAGSGAFGQLIRCLVAFAKEDTEDGDQRFVMSLEKNNLGRTGLPSHAYEIQSCVVQTDEGPSYVSRFVLGSETNTSVSEVMREESMPDSGKGEANENVEWLRGYLTDMGGSDAAADIKKAARKNGISDSAIDRAKRKLGVKAQHSGFGKERRSHWYLPEAAPRDDAS
jgi:5S rRNA maturation endonuclease (ribonuclease M5)